MSPIHAHILPCLFTMDGQTRMCVRVSQYFLFVNMTSSTKFHDFII
nr:MAG TPA: Ribonuclease H-like protein [Caudoviricetes sp.]